jgi:hypothetical protein
MMNHYQRWSDDEIDYLKSNFREKSDKEIADSLGRSRRSVGDRRRSLGLEAMPKNTSHGLMAHPTYNAWRSMKTRCSNPSNHAYHRYGGRGVAVCEEWINDFQAFYDWSIENGWEDGLSIDRIDNDGGYSPDNCRWATRVEQTGNRSTNRKAVIFGEEKNVSDWSRDRRCKVSYNVLWRRLLMDGITPEEALTKPAYEKIEAFGESKTLTEWSEDYRCKVCYNTLSTRIQRGNDLKLSIVSPPGELPDA